MQHTQVVRTLLARQRAGTRLVYIPGNHDASLAVLAGMLQGQFEVHREWVHRTARGERLLVLHGDQFDGVVPCSRWLARLGDALHDVTVGLSHRVNNVRRMFGKPYWALAESMKLSIAASVRRPGRRLPGPGAHRCYRAGCDRRPAHGPGGCDNFGPGARPGR